MDSCVWTPETLNCCEGTLFRHWLWRQKTSAVRIRFEGRVRMNAILSDVYALLEASSRYKDNYSKKTKSAPLPNNSCKIFIETSTLVSLLTRSQHCWVLFINNWLQFDTTYIMLAKQYQTLRSLGPELHARRQEFGEIFHQHGLPFVTNFLLWNFNRKTRPQGQRRLPSTWFYMADTEN
jgi:hypothetical protein